MLCNSSSGVCSRNWRAARSGAQQRVQLQPILDDEIQGLRDGLEQGRKLAVFKLADGRLALAIAAFVV
jgi:hypothetical protein